MAVRAQRWRGPRRPDVQELRVDSAGHTQLQQQQQQQQFDQTQQRSFDGSAGFNGVSTGTSSVRSRGAPSLEPAPAVPHFRLGFLSAGHGRQPGYGSIGGALSADDPTATLSGDAPLSFVNQRRGIMDATRSFDDGYVPLSAAEKSARALALARRENHAAGVGYGEKHPTHFAYLSRVLPSRAPAPFFAERPCVFPLHELPPLEAAADPPRGDLLALTYREQLHHQKPFKRRTASGLGYGTKRPQYYAYLANTYWRNHSGGGGNDSTSANGFNHSASASAASTQGSASARTYY